MEPKNCPDPRNCTKIHYFGRCPYKHQPCNRGTACSYVNQNNCQFYHPEEDYPQYKAKKAAMAKKEKRKSIITPLKIVTRQTKPSATQLASMASKAFAEMAALQKDKPSAHSSTVSSPSPLSKNSKIIQPPVRIVQCSPLKEIPIPRIQKKAERGLGGYHNELSVNSHSTRVSGGPISKLNEPKIPKYITKIKEQEAYMRELEDRIQNAERTAEFNRKRASELESSKQKFFTCWSRAVKTLELIRESGALLDDSLAQVIDIHSATLRRHESGSIYAPGLADLNPSVQKTSYRLHNGIDDRFSRQGEDTFFQKRGWGRSIGYHENSIFSNEPGAGVSEDDQDDRNVDDNFVNFVAEDMLSSLEL